MVMMGAQTTGRGGTRRAGLARSLLVTTALATVLPATPSLAQQAAEPAPSIAQLQSEQNFEIPTQPLTDALVAFGQQSGLQVTVDGTVPRGLASSPVSGTMTNARALDQLLSGSGLIFTMSGSTVVIERLETGDEDGAMLLDPISVEGATLGATTEGTGSYTTGSMNTATPIKMSIRETPQAVTVMTRQRMDDQGMSDITDVLRDTPGLTVNYTDGPGRPAILARGFYVDTVMQDGAMASWSSYMPTTKTNLAMFDRVEVVRGATGLMQGAGYPSASVNMIRKRPTRDFHGTVEGSVGHWSTYSGMVDVGGPLMENGDLRARVVAYGLDSESHIDRQDHQNGMFYGIGEADLGDRVTLSFGASYQTDSTDGAWWGGLPVQQNGDAYGFSRNTSFAYDWEYLDQTSQSIFGKVDIDLGGEWTVNLSADQNWSDLDALGSYVRTTYVGTTGTNYTQYWFGDRETNTTNLDAKVQGPFTLFDRKHDFAAGVSLYRFETKDTARGSGVAESVVDLSAFDPAGVFEPAPSTHTESHNIVTQRSGYMVGRFALLDSLKLILGGRLDWYDYNDKSGTSDYQINTNLTKYGGLIYDVDDAHSVYASYTDIFLPQSEVDTAGTVLEPIVGENYEIGIKGEYLNGALNTSLAVFYVEQSNRAMTVADPSTCTASTSCSEAAGVVRSQGVDLELQGSITPDWNIGAGYTYTRTEYIDDPDHTRGTKFDTALPEHMIKLSTMYHLPAPVEGMRIGGSLRWQSGIYEKTYINGIKYEAEQSPYAVVDLVAGYEINENLDAQLNLNNILDTQYYAGLGYDPRWGSMSTYGEPFNAKFTLKYHW